MHIEYYHASHYGNGARVAEEFQQLMAKRGVDVNIHHVKKTKPNEIPPADLYVLSSPGRFGKPIGDMQHFLKKAILPAGAKYALLATEVAPNPEQQRKLSNNSDSGKCQRVIPWMNEALQNKGLAKVVEDKIYVTGLKGPLEDGWRDRVAEYADKIGIAC